MDRARGRIRARLIAVFKRRAMARWYLYGFACTLVAWPLLAVLRKYVLASYGYLALPHGNAICRTVESEPVPATSIIIFAEA